ncbi:MAG: hypothetical protein R8F63_14320 [Acidimicrobiales bacterium]|nr:hypothetical protein [Acidimicrobiales bacterium]
MLGVSGLFELLTGRDQFVPLSRRIPVRASGLIKLAFAAAFVWTFFASRSLGLRRAGWRDEDGNGLMDPWDGNYGDRFDVAFDDWMFAWGLLNVALCGLLAVCVLALRVSPWGSPSDPRG